MNCIFNVPSLYYTEHGPFLVSEESAETAHGVQDLLCIILKYFTTSLPERSFADEWK
jgi:hypothetical protein